MKKWGRNIWLLAGVAALMCFPVAAHEVDSVQETAEGILSAEDLEKHRQGEDAEAETLIILDSGLGETDEATEQRKRHVTRDEYELLLRVCMSECGGRWGEPMEGKVAVVETVLNRSDMGWGNIQEVINAPGQYSTSDNGKPDETVVEAVEMALVQKEHPENMIYFRTNRYHGFGKPYKKIGNHYFSLSE